MKSYLSLLLLITLFSFGIMRGQKGQWLIVEPTNLDQVSPSVELKVPMHVQFGYVDAAGKPIGFKVKYIRLFAYLEGDVPTELGLVFPKWNELRLDMNVNLEAYRFSLHQLNNPSYGVEFKPGTRLEIQLDEIFLQDNRDLKRVPSSAETTFSWTIH
jgi:hypothetical protein